MKTEQQIRDMLAWYEFDLRNATNEYARGFDRGAVSALQFVLTDTSQTDNTAPAPDSYDPTSPGTIEDRVDPNADRE